MAFNINAQVILSAPKNIQKVRQTISKGLSGISANIDLKVDTKSTSALKSINVELEAMKNNLKVINAAKISLGNFRQFSSQATKTANSLSSIGTAAQKTNQDLSKTSKQVNQVTKDITDFGKESALATRRFAAFTIVSGGIFGLLRSFRQGVGDAINFEKQIIRVQQVTGDAGVGINSLKSEIDTLSVSLGVASDELVGVALTLAQTGKTIPQIRSALTAIAKSTLGPTFGNIKDTTEGVIAALEQFDIQASKTEEVLGSLNAVSKAFAVESADLISVIRRAGGVFAAAEPQFKGPQESLNELIALFTAVRSTTRESSETIATGLRTIFSRIQRPATVQFLRQFGVELVDAEGRFVGTFEAFKRIAAGIEGLRIRGDAIGLARIVEELGGIRQAGKIIPLLQNFAKAEDARRVALEGTASISEDVELAQKGLGFSVDQLKQKFTKFIRDVVESKSFQTLARTILALGDNLLSVVDALRPLLPLFTTIATIKVSESLINFSKGFLGGFNKLGGAEGLGERIGGLGSVDTVGESATNKVDRQVKETNNKALIDNTLMVSKNIDSLVTLNRTIDSLSKVSTTLMASMKSLESVIASNRFNQTPGGIYLPPSATLGSSPLKPPKRRSMGGPAEGNTLLKPGELVFDPETVKKMGLANLRKMNQGVSMVGGDSPIDSVPADLDKGSFVLNKKNSQKLNRGGSVRRTIADDLFAELDRNLGDVLEIPNEWLPENLRDNRTKKVSVAKLVKKLNARDAKLAKKSGRGVSTKFDSQRNIVQSSPERMAALESYRSQVERGEDIQYITPNEDKLYNSQMAFVKQMIREGILTEEDFEPEEFAVGGMVAKQASGYTPYKLGDIRRRRRRSTKEDGALTDQAKYYAMLRQKRFGRRFAGTDFEMEEFLEELKNKPQKFNTGGEVKFAGLFLINKMGVGRQGLADKISKGSGFFNFEGQKNKEKQQSDLSSYLKEKNKQLNRPLNEFFKQITSEKKPFFRKTDIEKDIQNQKQKLDNLNQNPSPRNFDDIQKFQQNIAFLENKKELAIKAIQDEEGYFSNIIKNGGKLSYTLGIGYPPEDVGKSVFTTAVHGFLDSTKTATKALSDSLGVDIGKVSSDEDLLKNIGIFDVAGKVFESAVNQLGPPLMPDGANSQRGFDFEDGLKKLSSKFSLSDFQNSPTDAKISLTGDNLSSIKNTKIPNFIENRINALIDPYKDDFGRVKSPKAKEVFGFQESLFRSIDVSSEKPSSPDEIKKQTAKMDKMSMSRSSGGNIKSTSDSVSTILTPGELVFPPDEAKRAGLANLMSFNKTGDPSFLNDFNPNNVSMVPGSGNTDTFPQMLPAGSFVVKKKSSETMGGGFQKLRAGGVVGTPQGLKAGGMAAPSLLGALGPAIPGLAMAATQFASIDFSDTEALFQNIIPMLGLTFGTLVQQIGQYKQAQAEYSKNQEELATSIPHLTDEVINAAKRLRSATGKGASISKEQEEATRGAISKRLQKLPEKDRAKELTRIKDSLTGRREVAKQEMGSLGRLKLGAREGFAKGIFGAGTKGLAQNLTKLTKGLGIAATASLAAGPIIEQFTSFIFKDNKRETLASGETGLTGKDASSRATVAASLKGGVSGGAIGFTVGNAIFPGAGGAIGAAAGAFLGAVNAAVNAKFEQLKFENLLRISDASKQAAEALEKLKDVSDAKQLEDYNKSIGELFSAQEQATQAIVNESIRIANRSWGEYFSEGFMTFNQGLYSLGEGIASSVSDFFGSFFGGGIAPDKEQQIRTDTFASGLQNIDANVLQGIVDNFSKIADQALSRLSVDQLKELENLDSSNILDYITVLEQSGDVYARETEALKQIVKTRANISGKTILESVAPENKKARSALLAPVEIFARELSQNKSIEQASKSAVGQFKGSISGGFQSIFKEAQTFDEISDIFGNLSAETKRQLATELGLSVSDLSKSMKALGEASGSADAEIFQQLASTNALRASMERINKTIDAVGTAFNQLASRFGNIASDLNIAAGNLQIDLDNIFSASGGSLTRKQNVNVFDNITGRSIDEFEVAVDRLAKAAGLAAEDMADIPATLVVAEKIPEILKKTVDAVRQQGVSGATDVSGVQLQDLFAQQIQAVSGISLDQLSDPIRESIMEAFMVALGETGSRSAESGGGGGGKLFSLNALEQAVKEGALDKISSELMEKIKQEASALENAISAFQDTMYQAAEFQRRILDEQMNASMEILNRQQSINNRFRKVLDLDFDPLQTAINNQTARISQLTGGQVTTTNPMQAANELLARQQSLRAEKDTLQQRQADMGPADASEAAELSEKLGSVQSALESNSKAIEELKSSNEILEAATETLTKANEARMSARERATMFASKIGDAKSPMELQEAMSEFLAPTIAASKMASGMTLSFKDFASIMGDPSQIQAAFGLSSMDMESTIANLMRGFTMTGGSQLLGPLLSERLFGAGATRMGESDEEKAAMGIVQASTDAANKLTEALSSENSIQAISKLQDFNKLVLDAGEAAVAAGERFKEFRRTMLEDMANAGGGSAGSGTPAGSPATMNRGGLMRFNQGGLVPNAILTPGEAVFSPSATKSIGVENLKNFNRGGLFEKLGTSAGIVMDITTPGMLYNLITGQKMAAASAGKKIGSKTDQVVKVIMEKPEETKTVETKEADTDDAEVINISAKTVNVSGSDKKNNKKMGTMEKAGNIAGNVLNYATPLGLMSGFRMNEAGAGLGSQLDKLKKFMSSSLMGFNQGGLVPNSILTPGETVFNPSATKNIGIGNLQKLNSGGVSTVPGVGSTDSVPAFLSPGSFVLNKHASRGLQGFAGGGRRGRIPAVLRQEGPPGSGRTVPRLAADVAMDRTRYQEWEDMVDQQRSEGLVSPTGYRILFGSNPLESKPDYNPSMPAQDEDFTTLTDAELKIRIRELENLEKSNLATPLEIETLRRMKDFAKNKGGEKKYFLETLYKSYKLYIDKNNQKFDASTIPPSIDKTKKSLDGFDSLKDIDLYYPKTLYPEIGFDLNARSIGLPPHIASLSEEEKQKYIKEQGMITLDSLNASNKQSGLVFITPDVATITKQNLAEGNKDTLTQFKLDRMERQAIDFKFKDPIIDVPKLIPLKMAKGKRDAQIDVEAPVASVESKKYSSQLYPSVTFSSLKNMTKIRGLGKLDFLIGRDASNAMRVEPFLSGLEQSAMFMGPKPEDQIEKERKSVAKIDSVLRSSKIMGSLSRINVDGKSMYQQILQYRSKVLENQLDAAPSMRSRQKLRKEAARRGIPQPDLTEDDLVQKPREKQKPDDESDSDWISTHFERLKNYPESISYAFNDVDSKIRHTPEDDPYRDQLQAYKEEFVPIMSRINKVKSQVESSGIRGSSSLITADVLNSMVLGTNEDSLLQKYDSLIRVTESDVLSKQLTDEQASKSFNDMIKKRQSGPMGDNAAIASNYNRDLKESGEKAEESEVLTDDAQKIKSIIDRLSVNLAHDPMKKAINRAKELQIGRTSIESVLSGPDRLFASDKPFDLTEYASRAKDDLLNNRGMYSDDNDGVADRLAKIGDDYSQEIIFSQKDLYERTKSIGADRLSGTPKPLSSKSTATEHFENQADRDRLAQKEKDYMMARDFFGANDSTETYSANLQQANEELQNRPLYTSDPISQEAFNARTIKSYEDQIKNEEENIFRKMLNDANAEHSWYKQNAGIFNMDLSNLTKDPMRLFTVINSIADPDNKKADIAGLKPLDNYVYFDDPKPIIQDAKDIYHKLVTQPLASNRASDASATATSNLSGMAETQVPSVNDDALYTMSGSRRFFQTAQKFNELYDLKQDSTTASAPEKSGFDATLSNTFDDSTTLGSRTQEFLEAYRKYITQKTSGVWKDSSSGFNLGGQIKQPNSILTPGEAVFTPNMSKSIGYDNLAYFNKTGDTSSLAGFNKGGITKVPGVGNTDSVPAYLPTGSFVVKKSSSANLPGFNRGTASSGTSSMQRMIGDFISFTKTFFNNLSTTLPAMKASETANSTTIASEKKAGNVQQVNNDIILLPQKLDESFRVFDSVATKFITSFNPLINQLDNAVTRLEALPALQVQLDAKVGPVEVILNGVELLGAFEERIKGTILSAVSQQIAKLVPNTDGSQKGLT